MSDPGAQGTPPAGTPPVMQFPPPVDADDLGLGPTIMGVLWTFTAIASMVVFLRFVVRRKLGVGWGWDDYLMLIAVSCQIISMGIFSKAYEWGLGKRDYNLRMPDEMVNTLKYNWVAIGPGQMTSILARVSITLSLIHLFGVHKWFKMFLIIITSLQTVVGIVMICLTYTQVRPVEGLWEVFRTDLWKMDPRVFLYTGYLGQSLYTFSDIAYVLLPVIIIWRLNMPLNRKLGLIILMAVSFFTMSMSILKIHNIHWQSENGSKNAMYNVSLQVLWAGMEQTCVIIMGCVPSLRGIVKVDMPLFSTIGNSFSSLLGSRRRFSSKPSTWGQSTGNHTGSNSDYLELERAGKSAGVIVGDNTSTEALQQHHAMQRHYGQDSSTHHIQRVDEYSVLYHSKDTNASPRNT